MSVSQKLVTVAEFPDLMEAQLAQITLEEAGIRSVLLGEPIVSGLYSTGIFAVSIQVLQKDVERAVKVLQSREPLEEDSEEDGINGDQQGGVNDSGEPL